MTHAFQAGRRFAAPVAPGRDGAPNGAQNPCVHDPLAAMEALATLTKWRRGQEIYGHGDRVDHWYRMISGAARKCAQSASGRRQIVDFLLPGDFFGFGARGEHSFAVEAVVDGTIVARYPRRRAEMLADSTPEIGRLIREMTFGSIDRLQMRVLILAQMTARAKVAAFLIEMAERSPAAPGEGVVLPMTRYDIADYLALAVETVSRVLTQFRRRRAITLVDTHRVRIVDRMTLEGWDSDD